MSQMALIHRQRYPNAFGFLSTELPKAKADQALWRAFQDNSHLTDGDAVAAVTMGSTAPLIFASNLGQSIWGQFDTDVPGRVEISIEVLENFEKAFGDPKAQEFLRAKVMHEMCHWGCFRGQIADKDEAGEKFERAVFNAELQPWWVPAGVAGPALGPGLNDFNDPATRASTLEKLLATGGFAPGRASDPDHAVFGGVDVAEGMRRGFRNNNPGNIRLGSAWRGLADPSDMKDFQSREVSFCVFREPEWGLRAIGILLRKYKKDFKLITPRQIISRWAPASDNNDVDSYAAHMAKALNTTPDSVVDADDVTTLVAMLQVIATHENGEPPPYADVQYLTALKLP